MHELGIVVVFVKTLEDVAQENSLTEYTQGHFYK